MKTFLLILISAEVHAVMWGGGLGFLGGIVGALVGAGSGRDSIYDLSEQHYLQKIQIIKKLSGYKQ